MFFLLTVQPTERRDADGNPPSPVKILNSGNLPRVASRAVRSVSFQKDPPPNQRRTLTAARAVSRSPAIKLSPPPKSNLFSLRSCLRLHATQRIAREGRRRGARVLISPRRAAPLPPWRGSCWRRSRRPRRRPTRRPGRTTRRRLTAASTRCAGCAPSASTPTCSSPRR
jgi:hypothetical protein